MTALQHISVAQHALPSNKLSADSQHVIVGVQTQHQNQTISHMIQSTHVYVAQHACQLLLHGVLIKCLTQKSVITFKRILLNSCEGLPPPTHTHTALLAVLTLTLPSMRASFSCIN